MRTSVEKSPLELWASSAKESNSPGIGRRKIDGCRTEEENEEGKENMGNGSWRQRHWLRVLGIETPIRQGRD